MGQYVARKRAKFKGFSGPVNIPWGAILEEQDGLLFWRGAAVCGVTSQNAFDFFSRDDDGQGKLRGKLVTSIKAKLAVSYTHLDVYKRQDLHGHVYAEGRLPVG